MMATSKSKMRRANFLTAPEAFHLRNVIEIVNQSFGMCYLVGSSLTKRDYRDVDIRCIMADEDFDRRFLGVGEEPLYDAEWSLICAAVSEWLQKRTGLPIDFQIQRMSYANKLFGRPEHQRQAIFVIQRSKS